MDFVRQKRASKGTTRVMFFSLVIRIAATSFAVYASFFNEALPQSVLFRSEMFVLIEFSVASNEANSLLQS